jgi:hypothetical protein
MQKMLNLKHQIYGLENVLSTSKKRKGQKKSAWIQWLNAELLQELQLLLNIHVISYLI